jgi:hypothetical protein
VRSPVIRSPSWSRKVWWIPRSWNGAPPRSDPELCPLQAGLRLALDGVGEPGPHLAELGEVALPEGADAGAGAVAVEPEELGVVGEQRVEPVEVGALFRLAQRGDEGTDVVEVPVALAVSAATCTSMPSPRS